MYSGWRTIAPEGLDLTDNIIRGHFARQLRLPLPEPPASRKLKLPLSQEDADALCDQLADNLNRNVANDVTTN